MLKAELILERLDNKGRLLEARKQQSLSFVRQFIQVLYLPFAYIEAGGYSVYDIGGVLRSVDSDGATTETTAYYGKSSLTIGSAPGDADMLMPTGSSYGAASRFNASIIAGQYIGIQVGSSSTAVAPTQTGMQTRIVHGVGAGQLEYGGCELRNLAFANPNGSFDIRRYFTNSSGGSVTVREVGVYGGMSRGIPNDDQASWAAMILRDVVSPDVVVANTEILRVTYTIQITV